MSTAECSSLPSTLRGHPCYGGVLLNFIEDSNEALDKGETVYVVSLDLRKAFDIICHRILLRKLKGYDFLGSPLKSILLYLIVHAQRIKIKKKKRKAKKKN